MKTQLMQSVSSAVRSVPLSDKGIRVSSLSACGLLLSVGMLAGCTDPAPSIAISEPDPELVFVRGYRSADDDCKLTGESAFTAEFLLRLWVEMEGVSRPPQPAPPGTRVLLLPPLEARALLPPPPPEEEGRQP